MKIDRRMLAVAIGLALAPWLALAGGSEETTAATEGAAAAEAAEPMAEIEGLVPGMVNFFATVTEYEQATGNRIASFQEAPMLAALVEAGELPPLAERMPADPMVIVPLESVGTYGGTLRHGALSPVTAGAESWTARTQPLLMVHPSLQPPAISWGVLLQDAQAIRSIALQPWLLIPGLFVTVAVLAFNFVGDGLRDASDPYSQ